MVAAPYVSDVSVLLHCSICVSPQHICLSVAPYVSLHNTYVSVLLHMCLSTTHMSPYGDIAVCCPTTCFGAGATHMEWLRLVHLFCQKRCIWRHMCCSVLPLRQGKRNWCGKLYADENMTKNGLLLIAAREKVDGRSQVAGTLILQSVAACSQLQRVAACCSVLQRVAACCNELGSQVAGTLMLITLPSCRSSCRYTHTHHTAKHRKHSVMSVP